MKDRTRVKRIPKRGHYDQETIHSILDKEYLCHIAFVHDGYPVVIPTLFGRSGNTIYLHGSSASRMMRDLSEGIELSFSVTRVNGIVLARSAFHHSMNYESVVLFGKAEQVTDQEEKMEGLKVVSDQVLKGRWEEIRLPSPIEMKATTVLRLPITEASAKIRTGPPGDNEEDYELDIWAGVVPVENRFLPAEADPLLKAGIITPASVKNLFTE